MAIWKRFESPRQRGKRLDYLESEVRRLSAQVPVDQERLEIIQRALRIELDEPAHTSRRCRSRP